MFLLQLLDCEDYRHKLSCPTSRDILYLLPLCMFLSTVCLSPLFSERTPTDPSKPSDVRPPLKLYKAIPGYVLAWLWQALLHSIHQIRFSSFSPAKLHHGSYFKHSVQWLKIKSWKRRGSLFYHHKEKSLTIELNKVGLIKKKKKDMQSGLKCSNSFLFLWIQLEAFFFWKGRKVERK